MVRLGGTWATDPDFLPPLVNAVSIAPQGAESPGSRLIGVIGALVYFLPSETVGACGGGGL